MVLCLCTTQAVIASDIQVAQNFTADDDSDSISNAIEVDDAVSDKLGAANDEVLSAGELPLDSLYYDTYYADEGSVIDLQSDYKYDATYDDYISYWGVYITKALTIDGHGHYIDGAGESNLMFIYADNVILKNITFINGVYTPVNVYGENVQIIDCTFINNTGTYGGAVCFYMGDGSLTDCKFENNTASYFAGAVDVYANNIKIDGCEFINNKAGYNGGAVYIEPGITNTEISNSKFTRNRITGWSSGGGAVNIAGSKTTIIDSTFEQNSGERFGGALYITGDDCSIQSTAFINNSAESGGAIYWNGNHGSLTDSWDIYENSATYGGAIYLNCRDVKIHNSRIHHNNAITGGGIYFSGPNTMTYSHIDYNNAQSGGGIYVGPGADGTYIDHTNFGQNWIEGFGAAIYWDGPNGIVNNSVFYNNAVSGRYSEGGAVIWYGDHGLINNSKFSYNYALGNERNAEGGALYAIGNDMSVENSLFEDNGADTYGGAIKFTGANSKVYNSIFNRNHASTEGGAIYSSGENFLVYNSTFNYNYGAYLGGALALEANATIDYSATIDHSKFVENTANKGGAIYWDALNGTVNNSYFYKNHAYYGGGAISTDYMISNAEKLIQNSVFKNNYAVNYGGAIASLYTEIVNSSFMNNRATTGEAIFSYTTEISEDSTFINNSAVLLPTELIEINYGDIIGNSTRKTNTTYIAVCVERYTAFPHLGIKDDSLNRLTNVISGESIADYLKILIFNCYNSTDDVFRLANERILFYPETQRDNPNHWNYLVEIPVVDYISRAVHEFSDHDYWNSDHPLVKQTLELYKTVYANGTNMPEKFVKVSNGKLIEYNFSSMISPTTQSLFLFTMAPYDILNKTYLNTTDEIFVNDTVAFNISVNNPIDMPFVNVTVVEIYNSTELEYIGHSNNKTWIKDGNTFTYYHVPDVGDIIVYTVNLKNTGNCAINDIKFNITYDSSILEYVKTVGGVVVSDGVNFTVKDSLDVNENKTYEIWLKVLSNDAAISNDISPEVMDLNVMESSTPDVKVPEISIQYDLIGRFPVFNAGESSTFTIWFRTLTNGTLVNNVSLSTDAFKDLIASNYTKVIMPLTKVNVTKVWQDANNQDGVRPESVTVVLVANGREIDSVELNVDNNWTALFEDLPVFEAGEVIKYSVQELSVKNYTCNDPTNSTPYNWTIVNVHTPLVTEVNVTKKWIDADNQDGVRPESVTVVLVADGNVVDSAVLDANNDWTATFNDLPVYSAGKIIKYSVQELSVENYTCNDPTNSTPYNWTIVNVHTPLVTEVNVAKKWIDADNQDGVRPESVTVVLVADGNVVDSAVLDADNDWTATFNDLPVYEAGKVIKYAVEELSVANYSSVVSNETAYVWTVTNTHVPVVTEVNVAKKWIDADNQDGVRPESVTVVLVADGNVIDSAVLDEGNDWAATFGNLPVYNAGEVIKYAVRELSVANYSSVVSNETAYVWTVTNTHTPVVTEVNVAKKWIDADNQDGVRPESVTVVLVADG
ncbi:Cna B-type domain-containing protein, partial [Methanobrevibacter sp.]